MKSMKISREIAGVKLLRYKDYNECDLKKALAQLGHNMLDLSFEFSNYSKEKIELKKHCADAPQGRWNREGMGGSGSLRFWQKWKHNLSH